MFHDDFLLGLINIVAIKNRKELILLRSSSLWANVTDLYSLYQVHSQVKLKIIDLMSITDII